MNTFKKIKLIARHLGEQRKLSIYKDGDLMVFKDGDYIFRHYILDHELSGMSIDGTAVYTATKNGVYINNLEGESILDDYVERIPVEEIL